MLTTLSALSVASVLYVLGGIAMKYSQAYKAFVPSVLVFVCFGLAAAIQTWAMNKAELGKGYVFVLGLEAILSILAGAVFFQETMNPMKSAGVVLILIGIILMKGIA